MKVKSLAMGMIVPLAASVALTTAPTASAATPTKATFNQTGVADRDRDRGDRDRGDRDRGDRDRGDRYRDRDRYDRGRYDRYRDRFYRNDYRRYGYGFGSRWIYCYNPYLGWHAHYRWDRLHRWDQCSWRR